MERERACGDAPLPQPQPGVRVQTASVGRCQAGWCWYWQLTRAGDGPSAPAVQASTAHL